MSVEEDNLMKLVKITEAELDISEAYEFVSAPALGAISIFAGTTRNFETNGEDVVKIDSLFYDHYETMALKLMHQIVDKTLQNGSGISKCYLVHRVGKVDAGKASILIACSSSHRAEAHKTVMNILNDVKSQVPIWKRPCASLNVQLGNWSEKSEAFWLSDSPADVEPKV